MSHLYAADGSWNVTVVDGATLTGGWAADGSLNVKKSSGGTVIGLVAPCGALNVTLSTGAAPTSVYAPDGSLYVTVSPYTPSGGQRVTVVSGSLTPSPGSTNDLIWGLAGTFGTWS